MLYLGTLNVESRTLDFRHWMLEHGAVAVGRQSNGGASFKLDHSLLPPEV